MKKILLLPILIILWHAAYTETIQIHHIGVGQGDATLIIITNDAGEAASILIDAGNSSGKGEAVAATIMTYPELVKNKKLDLIIVSHLHSDHLGGIQTTMTSLLSNGWGLGVVIDRGGTFVPGIDSAGFDGIDTDPDNDPSEPIPTSVLVKRYNAFVEDLLAHRALSGRYNVHLGVNVMGFITGFACSTSLRSLTSNGLACNKANDVAGCDDWRDQRSNARNENDYSYSFLLQLGSFKYFTGGDIGGNSSRYLDLETPLISYFRTRPDATGFHFCGYKASHHGSAHSTSTEFVNYTRPTVTVVPSALRSFNGTKLPSQSTLSRIEASSTNRSIYYTYVSDDRPYRGKVTTYMDIILLVDGSNYESTHAMLVKGVTRHKTTLTPASSFAFTETVTCTKH
jgi:competence protein ComEC